MLRRILVVDDDIVIRELLKNLLEGEGYEVLLAGDGVSGVESALSECPDLVILDGLLPRLHGFLACKAIKEQPLAPKVILLTGIYTKPNYKREVARDYGADDMLAKPATAAVLLAVVEKHLKDLPIKVRVESIQPELSSQAFSIVEDHVIR